MRPIAALMICIVLAACEKREEANKANSGEPSSNAVPQAPPSAPATIDCDRASGQAEQAVCADQELLALDRLAGPADEQMRSTRQACGRDDDLKSCLVHVYARRIAGRAEGGQVDSAVVGPVAFACGAEEVAATFINSGQGYLVLKTEGTAAVLPRSPAASGSRYEGPAGEERWSFWNKGREATLVRAGHELACKEAPADPAAL